MTLEHQNLRFVVSGVQLKLFRSLMLSQVLRVVSGANLVEVETRLTWSESAQGIVNHYLLQLYSRCVKFVLILLLLINLREQLNARLEGAQKL